MDTVASTVLTAVGTCTLLSTSYRILSILWTYLRPSSLPRYLKTKDGSAPWALVTGASDGIGKAFSAALASRGFNVVLHGRNPAKLARVEAELQARYPDQRFRVAIADARDLSSRNIQQVTKQVEDVTLKILINNAGTTMAPGHEFDLIETYTSKELEDSIAINGTFPILLTGALMPKLVANEPSLILNVGTLVDIGMPLFPAYAPAKAALEESTAELKKEQIYAKRDIEVIMMRPAQVANTGTIVLPPSFLVPDAPTWVEPALVKVGCGCTQLFPYIPHALQAALLQGLPGFLGIKAKFQAVEGLFTLDVTGHGKKATEGTDKKRS